MNDINNHIFIFLGAPGVGKGAISHKAIERFGWKKLSTGDLCRKHISEGTLLGKEIDFAIKSGKLVSDLIIIEMVKSWLIDQIKLKKSVILDGFPRTVIQAEGLLDLMQSSVFNEISLIVVEFVLDDELIVKRLTSRLICSNKVCQKAYSTLYAPLQSKKQGVCDDCSSLLIQRADDKEDIVRDRLKVYKLHVQALKQFYKERSIPLVTVNAHQSVENVFDSFLSIAGLSA